MVGTALVIAISVLIKEAPQSSLAPATPKTTLTRTPGLGLPASGMVSDEPFLLYKQPPSLCYFVVTAPTN